MEVNHIRVKQLATEMVVDRERMVVEKLEVRRKTGTTPEEVLEALLVLKAAKLLEERYKLKMVVMDLLILKLLVVVVIVVVRAVVEAAVIEAAMEVAVMAEILHKCLPKRM